MKRPNQFRNWKRLAIKIGIFTTIIWIGFNAISHISELYDGLCEVQGAGMGKLLYDDNKLGYCTGIGDDLSSLALFMVIAAIAVPSAFAIWWHYSDERKNSN